MDAINLINFCETTAHEYDLDLPELAWLDDEETEDDRELY